MNVCLIQQDIVWGDVRGNLEHLDSWLGSVPDAGLYLFPEMFTTGFATTPGAAVEQEPSAGLERRGLRQHSAQAGRLCKMREPDVFLDSRRTGRCL